MSQDPWNLKRFVDAQQTVYPDALSELRAGRKRTHWMWFVFPQVEGLGHSDIARQFAIRGLDEARAYLAHPVLGPRLLECTRAILDHSDNTLMAILGYPDDLKFGSSMTLFAQAAGEASPFSTALALFCGGEPDGRTLKLLVENGD